MPEEARTRAPRAGRRWLAVAAIALPLAILLGLQLRTLARLQETSAVAQRVTLRAFAKAVLRDVEDLYLRAARESLDVPGELVRERREDELGAHFARRDGRGVKRFFVVPFGGSGRAPILFFAPDGRRLEAVAGAPETRAVNVATAPWQLFAEEDAPVESLAPVANEQFPENRVVLRPIVDGRARLLGVAGLVADGAFVRERFLPERIEAQRARLAEPLRSQIAVALRPRAESDAPAAITPEAVELPFRFLFSDWILSVSGRAPASEQWARRSLWLNLALTLVMTAVLASAILLALRNAARATKLSQMKTEFVSNVSHELRTPLASIRVFGEFLRLGRVSDPEKIREYGEYIESESERLTQLVNNILDFSRIESGQKSYRFEKVDLAELVAATLKACEVRLRQAGFAVEVRAPAGLPPAWADPSAIAQVLLNLFDNAIKYSGESRVLSVELDARDGFVCVAVGDRGLGIAPEEQGRIFEKFYRVGTGLVHDAKGSGLGLAIVKHVVEAHRGSVEVRSAPGQGSTFTIRLPTHGA